MNIERRREIAVLLFDKELIKRFTIRDILEWSKDTGTKLEDIFLFVQDVLGVQKMDAVKKGDVAISSLVHAFRLAKQDDPNMTFSDTQTLDNLAKLSGASKEEVKMFVNYVENTRRIK